MGEERTSPSWDSLAPVPVEGANPNAPRGRPPLLGLPSAVGLVVVALWAGTIWYTGLSTRGQYASSRQVLQDLEAAHFQGFWSCALNGAPIPAGQEGLAMALHTRVAADATGLAQRIEHDCIYHLYALTAQLGSIQAPPGVEAQFHKMRRAAHGLRNAWQAYADRAPTQGAEADVAGITRAYNIYRSEQQAAQRIMNAKLR